MLLEWEEYSRIRYAAKLKIEKFAVPEIAIKSGKVFYLNCDAKIRVTDQNISTNHADGAFRILPVYLLPLTLSVIF